VPWDHPAFRAIHIRFIARTTGPSHPKSRLAGPQHQGNVWVTLHLTGSSPWQTLLNQVELGHPFSGSSTARQHRNVAQVSGHAANVAVPVDHEAGHEPMDRIEPRSSNLPYSRNPMEKRMPGTLIQAGRRTMVTTKSPSFTPCTSDQPAPPGRVIHAPAQGSRCLKGNADSKRQISLSVPQTQLRACGSSHRQMRQGGHLLIDQPTLITLDVDGNGFMSP